MRVVIELRRGELTEVMLNNLYTHTQDAKRVRYQHGGAGEWPTKDTESEKNFGRGSSTIVVKWLHVAPYLNYVKRVSVPIFWKVWRLRWRILIRLLS